MKRRGVLPSILALLLLVSSTAAKPCDRTSKGTGSGAEDDLETVNCELSPQVWWNQPGSPFQLPPLSEQPEQKRMGDGNPFLAAAVAQKSASGEVKDPVPPQKPLPSKLSKPQGAVKSDESLLVGCKGKNRICVPQELCVDGYVQDEDILSVRTSAEQKCKIGKETCCLLKGHALKARAISNAQFDLDQFEDQFNDQFVDSDPGGYLPPLGSEPSSNVPAFSNPPKPADEEQAGTNEGGPSRVPFPSQPQEFVPPVQLGCAAALLCVEEQFCNMAGVITTEPIALSSEQMLRRVPLNSCKNPDNGVIGKCCRDPNYVDPWPAGNLPANYSGGFDEQGFPTFLNIAKQRPPSKKTPPAPTKTVQPLIPQQQFLQPVKTARPLTPQPVKTFQPQFPQPVKTFQPQFPQPVKTFQPQFPQPVKTFQPQPELPLQPALAVQSQYPQPVLTALPQFQSQFPQPSQQSISSLPSPFVEHQVETVVSPHPFTASTVAPFVVPVSSVTPGPTSESTIESFVSLQPDGYQKVNTIGPYSPYSHSTPTPVYPPSHQPHPTPSFVPVKSTFHSRPIVVPHGEERVTYDSSSTIQNSVFLNAIGSRGKSASTCGIRNIGGARPSDLTEVDVAFGEITWQAMILSNNEKKLLCSGVIVSPNVVLTAAHCVEGLTPSAVSVKAGEWKLGYELKHEEPLPFEIVNVDEIILHPRYTSGLSAHDVAMLLLEHPFKLDAHVAPICLGDLPRNPSNCIATGWGKVVLQVHAAGALMHSVDVNLIPTQQCRQRVAGAESLLDIEDDVICGAAQQQANNMCQVDVGGPLACDSGDGVYTLAGIYSQDTGCLPTNQVTTFARIDINWIQSVLHRSNKVQSEVRAEPTIQQQTFTQEHQALHEAGKCDCQNSNLSPEGNQYLPPV